MDGFPEKLLTHPLGVFRHYVNHIIHKKKTGAGMKLHNALISRIAAVAMALGVAQFGSAAQAQDTAPEGAPDTPAVQVVPPTVTPPPVIQTTDPAAPTLVNEWSVKTNPRHIPGVPDDMLPGVLLGLGGLMGLMCLYAASRRMKGAWIYAAASGVVLVTMANPEIVREVREPLSTQVTIVVDKSASQSLDGRAERTAETYRQLVAELGKVPGLEIRTVEAGAQPGVDGTNLGEAMATELADIAPDRLGAVIILTDGQVHDINGNTIAPDAPLHVLLSGRRDEMDRSVEILEAPSFGIVNQEQTLRFRVNEVGMPGDGNTPVIVRISIDGQDVGAQSVTPGEIAEVKVTLPHAGANVIALETETVAGEMTNVNNRAAASVKGVRDKLRVLLVSGQPNQGERAWRTLLKSDPALDLIHFTILRSPEKFDGTPVNEMSLIAFPSRELFEQKLNDFDLIIFDHYRNNGVLPQVYFENIANYVNNGGALMVIAGPEYATRGGLANSPLASILPAMPTGHVTEGAFTPERTPDGARHPVTRDLTGADAEQPAWGDWYHIIDTTDPQGYTVMSGTDDKALMVLARENEGRVAMILSDDTWLWARGHDGGGPYAEMMQRVSHWLLKEPDLEEEALRMTMQDGKLQIERQTMADEVAPVTLRGPSGTEQTVTLEAAGPGLWRATVDTTETGLYEAIEGNMRTLANIGPANPREFVDTRSTQTILKPLVDETHGHIGNMSAMPRIVPMESVRDGAATGGADWMGIRMSGASDLKDTARNPLVNPWVSLLLFMGLMGWAWQRGTGQTARREKNNNGPQNNGPKI